MSSMKWTPAQQSAIEDEGGTLLVSAAAGSGKTAVLVERAVRLVCKAENPLSADRLLIVTFTNAAAEELRSRIGSRLEEELRRRPGDYQLRKQRLLLRRAFIGTMDSFCQQLVRENFAQLAIPPDIMVGDRALLGQLSVTAIEQTMEEMHNDSDFSAFASLYGRSRSDRAAEETVLALYEFVQTLPQPEKYLQQFTALYKTDKPLQETLWGKEIFRFAEEGLGALIDLCRLAINVVAEEPELAALGGVLETDLTAFEEGLLCLRQPNWDAVVERMNQYPFPQLRGGPRGYESAGKERVKELRNQIKAIHGDLLKYCFVCTEEEFHQDCAKAGPFVQALCTAAARYSALFKEAKLAEKVLDFADFEHLALQLLVDENGKRTPMANLVSGRFGAVMIDEYQDTNELQDALYTCLGNPEGSNIFYVGDVKQSIYRFRKANPGLFLAKKDAFAEFETGIRPAVLTLGHNFRSGEGVVAGVNYVFETLMSQDLGEVVYNQEEKLIQGASGGAVDGFELQIVTSEEESDATYIASRIAAMVQEKMLVRDKTGERPCNYGDFCILLRARTSMDSYTKALENKGIPVVADNSEDLLSTPEVLPLSAVLAAIDNPGDDVSLTATLVGPLFRFSPDEITRLRAETPRGNIWSALIRSKQPKAEEFVRKMSFYRVLAGEMPVGQLCSELLERTGYLSAVGAMEGGTARQENLYRFMGWAADVSASGRGGLAGFVRLLQSGRGPDGAAVKSLPGHVTILTIHKSKGLEFPVCFLADAAHKFNTRDLSSRVQMHTQLGIGMWLRAGDVLFPTLAIMAIRRRIERESLSEEMRVLYVALTRAKDRMIVTFGSKDPEGYLQKKAAILAGGMPGTFVVARGRHMADWLVPAALCHPEAGPLLAHTNGVIPPCNQTDSRFVMGVQPAVEEITSEQESFAITAEADAVLVEELLRGFSQQIPRKELSEIPRKVSVSAITKPDLPSIRKRPSFMYKTGLTAAEKGTAQHSFMQYADFAKAETNLLEEVQRLVDENYLPQDLAEKLDLEGIKAFLASPIAKRMNTAEAVHREYDFITAVPAALLQPDLPPELGSESVLVQGIADAVLLFDDHMEIVDYKTDKGKSGEILIKTYQKQLQLYRDAIEKRFSQPVTKLTIWSFHLAAEIDVPL